jgi:hypothetical protein
MSADIFVYLDTVQFSKNGVQNRNQIKTSAGALWLTVPVKHEFGSSILQTTIANRKAVAKHWKTIANSYSKTTGFERWGGELSDLLNPNSDSLAALAMASTDWMLEKMEIQTRRMLASEISEAEGKASTLVAAICKALGATTYLTGTGALAYLEPADFTSIGCEISVQQWQPFAYEQAHAEIGFVPELSALDLLLNCPDSAVGLIESAGSWKPQAASGN